MPTTAYQSSYTGAQIDAAVGAVSSKADKISEVNHGTSDTTFTLTANTMHIWGTVSSLTLSLPTDSNSYLDEFMFTFTSGSTATTLSLPSSVKWVQDLSVETNKTYQVSIINNLAGWLTNGMPSGGGSGGGGENNVIESISVNSVAQTVDANKNVNLQFKTINSNSITGTGDITITASTPFIEMYATWDSNDEYLENLNFYDAAEAYNAYNTAASPVVFVVATGTMQGGSFVEDDHYYYCEMEYEDANTGFGFSFYDSNEKYRAWIIYNNNTLVVNSFTHNTIGGGEANVIESISVNNVAQTVTNKNVNITVPTKVSDITNDSGYTTNTGTITGVNMNGASKGTSGVVDLGTVITSETQLSKGTTTGSGNAVTDISVSNHQITLTKGTTFLTSSDTVTIYSGSSAPSSGTGSNGDIYIQTS